MNIKILIVKRLSKIIKIFNRRIIITLRTSIVYVLVVISIHCPFLQEKKEHPHIHNNEYNTSSLVNTEIGQYKITGSFNDISNSWN